MPPGVDAITPHRSSPSPVDQTCRRELGEHFLGINDHRDALAAPMGISEDALCLVVVLADRAATSTARLASELLLSVNEPRIGISQEDEAEHRHRVFGRFEARVRPEFVGRGPEAAFDLPIGSCHPILSVPCSVGCRGS